ncbi:glycosyltransferase family 39 protein [Luteibacter sp. 22Crub2.1]|uniref:ArnT family glycosyltransferase n=1 Tax=Luteibacter sp. 22Crub2.1 TaxID=1283288 RepID=UPI0009A5DFE6|nr:glycosyltransferase family 39 protein [Luteibacter sp. 22Crub2.1]SKB56622.1 4-amino-4-deoxy-L-arabinose transferase [Luteibacter sp. 22Crub2.1]
MLIALAVLAAGIGLRDPWPPDEPRFALVARQMLESGQWLFPHRGMELYSDKPPMLMWTEAAWMWLTGGWRGAFLLTSLLSGLGTLALVWHAGRRLWDARTGLYAAIVVLSTMQFIDVIRHAQIDPLSLFWITLGNVGILIHCLRGPSWRMYWLGCFAAGLGVITKGVGIVALLMLIPYGVMRFRQWPGVTRTQGDGWRWAGGALAFLIAVSLWLAPMLIAAYGLRTPEYLAYVQDILFRQTAERYANSWQHAEYPWFFLGVILQEWVPVWLLIPLMLPRWREALRLREPRVWMPLVSFLLILVFFSIPRGKRAIYILPALPMLALAIAPYLGELLKARWLQRFCLALTAICGAVFGGVGLWALLKQPRAAQKMAARYELTDGGHTLWLALVVIGVLFLVCAALWRTRRGVIALLVGMAAGWIVWPVMTYPALNANESARQVMMRADQLIGADGQLGMVLWREENLLQAVRPVKEFGFSRSGPEQLADGRAWQREDPSHRWLLVTGQALDDCVVKERVVFVGLANGLRYSLLPSAASKAACVPSGLVTDR